MLGKEGTAFRKWKMLAERPCGVEDVSLLQSVFLCNTKECATLPGLSLKDVIACQHFLIRDFSKIAISKNCIYQCKIFFSSLSKCLARMYWVSWWKWHVDSETFFPWSSKAKTSHGGGLLKCHSIFQKQKHR